MKKTSFSSIQTLVLFCTIATGFSGLVYEVTWHRYIHNIAGSEARATAIILAVFLGGLSIGYEIFGRWSKQKSSYENLKAFGFAELGIGTWAILFDYIYRFGFGLSTQLKGSPVAILAGEFLVACIILGPPTVLMGGTLPLLTQGLSKSIANAQNFHAKVYALNTFGAFAGCLAAGFFLLPSFGLPLTMLYMAMINIMVGFFIILLSKKLQFGFQNDTDQEPQIQNGSSETSQLDASLTHADSDTGKEFIKPMRGFLIALLAGFYSIALQTVFVRMTGLTMGASEYAFSMIVSLFILMLAAGAWGIGKKEKISLYDLRKNQILITLGGLFVYASIPYWPYVNHLVRIIFSNSKIAFWGYFAANFILLGLVLSVLLGSMGRTMPLLFSTSDLQKNSLGKRVGDLYGVNSLGCLLGALLGGYLFFFWLNLDSVFKVCIFMMTITIVLSHSKKNLRSSLIWAASLIVVLLMLKPWNKSHFGFGLFRSTIETRDSYHGKEAFYEKFNRNRKLLAYGDGPNGTIAVFENEDENTKANSDLSTSGNAPSNLSYDAQSKDMTKSSSSSIADAINQESMQKTSIEKTGTEKTGLQPANHADDKEKSLKISPDEKAALTTSKDIESEQKKPSRSIVVNGKSDGATSGGDLSTTRALAHIPALLNKTTTGEAAVIGFGTGITAGNLTLYEHIKQIECIELSENVRNFSHLFAEANLNVTQHPKFKWVAADAYRALLSSSKTYDIIVSEPSNPWVTGVERLYSQEFYQIVKEKLSQTGIYAQWFHTYSISEDTLSMVFKTYNSVFPFVYTFVTVDMDLIILGTLNPLDHENLALMEERFKNKDSVAPLQELKLGTPYALLGKEVWNDPEIYKNGAIHSIDFPKLAYFAGKDFFQNNHLMLPNFIERPEHLKNMVSYASKTLFSIYDQARRSADPKERKRQIEEICGIANISQITHTWIKGPRPCRSAVYLALENKIFDPKEFDYLQLLKDTQVDQINVDQALTYITAFERLHSSYSPLDSKRLIERSSICHTDKSRLGDFCRSRLITLLRILSEDTLADKLQKQFKEAGLGGVEPEN